jgi:hypothetical protein
MPKHPIAMALGRPTSTVTASGAGPSTRPAKGEDLGTRRAYFGVKCESDVVSKTSRGNQVMTDRGHD